MNPKILYKQLREELERLGWKAESLILDAGAGTAKTQNTIFQHPQTNLYIVLPYMLPKAVVEPIYLLRVRNVLENAGFWDSLVRQSGTDTREEAIQVLQTLAGIKNGK